MLKKVLTGIFALTAVGYAGASTTTYTTQNWDLRSGNANAQITGSSWLANSSGSTNNYYNYALTNTVRTTDDSQINMSVGTVGMKVTAWSSTGNGACGTGVECGNTAARDDDPFIQRAILTQYSTGLGAVNRDEGDDTPNHALDNTRYTSSDSYNELDFDMVLFEFDTAVELTSVKAGYTGSDSDLSIVGYTGTGSLGANPFGNDDTKWSDLLSQGWSSITDTFDQGTSTQNIAPGFESRYWLVGVYNPVFRGTSYSHHNDAIKLHGVTTKQREPSTSVPEPTSIALMLFGFAAIFRKKLHS